MTAFHGFFSILKLLTESKTSHSMKLFIAVHSSVLQHKMFPCAYQRLKLNLDEETFPEGANQKGRQIGLLAGGKLRLLAFGEQRAACPLLPVWHLVRRTSTLPPSHHRNFKYLCLCNCINCGVRYSVLTDKVCFFSCSLSNMSLLLNV